MLDEHDLAVIVFDDVVAVEPIAVLIEIVSALGARVVRRNDETLAGSHNWFGLWELFGTASCTLGISLKGVL
jgi:hypothetical protein